jgi:predicted phage-related endonuclease
MAITAEQREARKTCIGSSDTPALCGVGEPWGNIHDLWLEKTGKLEDRPASEDCERGNDLEPVVLSWFERRMGVRLARNIELRNGGIFGANLDAAITSDIIDLHPIKAVVEAKTTTDGDEWGEGIEDVPLRVFVQVQHQMMVAECAIAYIPVLIPKYREFHFEAYQVQRHDGLIAQIRERGEWFWEKHVLRDIPPPAVMPHLETIKRIRREPTSKIALDGEALAAWTLMENLKATRKELDEGIEATYSQILSMLGQAEAGELEDGSMLTYLEQNGQRTCDWTLLEMRLREIGHAEIFSELVKQGRHRVLRLKRAKAK